MVIITIFNKIEYSFLTDMGLSMIKFFKLFLFIQLVIKTSSVFAIELVIGTERLEPGITFVFEGAIKDHIIPSAHHLAEEQTHVHIEARANWSADKAPKGAPDEGFVAYLNISATVTNEVTGLSTFIDLLPHINLIDNYHYARNMTLPGKPDETYTVEFSVSPPSLQSLALHRDWVQHHGAMLAEPARYRYEEVDFLAITQASR